jgi:hypothetical protein
MNKREGNLSSGRAEYLIMIKCLGQEIAVPASFKPIRRVAQNRE